MMSVRKIALSVLTVGMVGSFLALDAQGPSEGKQPDNKAVVAVVNGIPITRQQLADELIARKGRAQLEHRVAVKTEALQREVTEKLEKRLGDLRKELDQAIGRATVAALRPEKKDVRPTLSYAGLDSSHNTVTWNSPPEATRFSSRRCPTIPLPMTVIRFTSQSPEAHPGRDPGGNLPVPAAASARRRRPDPRSRGSRGGHPTSGARPTGRGSGEIGRAHV